MEKHPVIRIIIALEVSPNLNPNVLSSALLALCGAVAQSNPDEYNGFATDAWLLTDYARSGSLLPLPNPIGIQLKAIGNKHDDTKSAPSE